MVDGQTALDQLRHSGSLKILFPRAQTNALDAVLVNTAGGITGGDQFALSAKAGAGSTLTLTTQAAERAYKAQPGQIGHVRNTLAVGEHARMNWLPQETILFQSSALTRKTHIDLAQTASLLFCEPLILGRAAMGEVITQAHWNERLNITRNDAPLFGDAVRLSGDLTAHFANTATGGGATAFASIVYIAQDAAAHLDAIRAALPETAGVSLLYDDVLCARLLAVDGYALRQSLIPILTRLKAGPLPRPWML